MVELSIPRRIIQTAQAAPARGSLVADAIDGMLRMNPGYDYAFFNDEQVVDYMSAQPTEISAAFHALNPRYGAARADLFRYVYIYNEGGVYLDIKSACSVPFEKLHGGRSYVLAQWDASPDSAYRGWRNSIPGVPGGEFQQWHLMAKPRHIFLESVIRAVLKRVAEYDVSEHGVGWRAVMWTTGPGIYTHTIYSLMLPMLREGQAPDEVLTRFDCRALPSTNPLIYNVYDQHPGARTPQRFKSSNPHYSAMTEPLVLGSR